MFTPEDGWAPGAKLAAVVCAGAVVLAVLSVLF
jgi:hypothetical protein